MCVLRMTVWSPRELLDQLAGLDDLLRVEAGRRLVEDEHLGVVEQRLREADALPVALRELAALAVRHVGDPRALHHRGHARLALGPRHALDARAEVEILAHAHVGVERRRLGQIAGAALGLDRLLDEIEAGHDGGALGGRHVAGEHAHGRGLAGAVRAEKAEDLAAFDREADVVDGGEGAVPLGEVLDLDHVGRLREVGPCSGKALMTGRLRSPQTTNPIRCHRGRQRGVLAAAGAQFDVELSSLAGID